MSYILFFIVLALVIASMLKVKQKSPKQYEDEAVKAYKRIMEDIAMCEGLNELMAMYDRINSFKMRESWKSIDGCKMVDSIEEYYNDTFERIVYDGALAG